MPAGAGGAAGLADAMDAAGAAEDARDDRVGDAGQPAAGGEGGGAAGTGGAATGVGGTAGATGVGGVAGSSAGGAGALGGAGGDGPLPSPGCALANPAPPEMVEDTVHKWEVLRKFPSGYDGKTPMPLLLALHATNYTARDMWTKLIRDQPLASPYVFVGPQELPSSFSTFEGRRPYDFSMFVDGLLKELCVDERRIFGAGNGSGGRFLISWISATANPVFNVNPTVPALRGAAMVGTYITSGARQGPLPTIFIHPVFSNQSASSAQDPDGAKAALFFATRNACGASTMPAAVASPTGCGITPGCVDFDSCAVPFRWCQHNGADQAGDPWPCFASAAILAFFQPH